MAEKRKVINLFERTNLLGECVPGVPLVEIVSSCRVLIENHFGICAYCRDKIRIKVRNGIICVSGACLEIAKMTRHQVVITGKISAVIIDT